MEKKTEKITVSLSPEVIRLADQNWEKFGFKNRSELIDAAIREYISRDLLKEFTGELSQFYQKIERSEIKHLEEQLGRLENRICRQLFRICVEQEMACHMFASQCLGEPKETLEELRKTCVRDVKRTTGSIRYDRIYAYQRGGLEPEEDEDGEEN